MVCFFFYIMFIGVELVLYVIFWYAVVSYLYVSFSGSNTSVGAD